MVAAVCAVVVLVASSSDVVELVSAVEVQAAATRANMVKATMTGQREEFTAPFCQRHLRAPARGEVG